MISIVTVAFIESQEHYTLAKKSYETFTASVPIQRIVIVNKVRGAKDLEMLDQYNDLVITNDTNNLGKAWNLGVENAKYDYVFIPNLDVELKSDALDALLKFAEENPGSGLWSMTAINNYLSFVKATPKDITNSITNHSQSFSSFLIHKDTIKEVGKFNEDFTGAYYEDCAYLYRCKQKGLTPLRTSLALFFHHLQASVKYGLEYRQVYNTQLEQNRLKYIQLFGGEPGDEK